jgi:hypothetical protein
MQVFLLTIGGGYYGIDALAELGLVQTPCNPRSVSNVLARVRDQLALSQTDEELGGGILVDGPLFRAYAPL